MFDEFSIPGTLAINGCAIEAFPPIVRAAVERKWEFIGHGFTQRSMQKVPNEHEDMRKMRAAVIRQKPDVLFWTGEQIYDWYLAAGPRAP